MKKSKQVAILGEDNNKNLTEEQRKNIDSIIYKVSGMDLTDTAESKRFISRYNNMRFYFGKPQTWYYYDRSNGIWKKDEVGYYISAIKSYYEEIRTWYSKSILPIYMDCNSEEQKVIIKLGIHIHNLGNVPRQNRVLYSAASEVPISLNEFDTHPDMINMKNGTFDLQTLELKSFNQNDYLTMQMNVEYDANATCKLWEDTIAFAFNNDTSRIEQFRQICGYSLLHGNPKEYEFFLKGNTNNGKSTILDVLLEIFGSYGCTMKIETLLMDNNASGSSQTGDVSRMKNKRFVACSETDNKHPFSLAKLKLFSGKDTIASRNMYETDSEEFKATWKMFISTNDTPIIPGWDAAIHRRFFMIPFDVEVPPERLDTSLPEKLKQESAGIFNWMLAGLSCYRKNGFIASTEESEHMKDECRANMNTVFAFLNLSGKVVHNQEAHVAKTRLFESYLSWCREEERIPYKRNGFYTEVLKQSYKEGKDTLSTRIFIGLMLDGDIIQKSLKTK